MSILVRPEVNAVSVRVTAERVYIELSDGREVGVPLARFEFLHNAPPESLANWQIEPRGFAVYWPDLNDGLEVRHLLATEPL
jgi:hypothetical protein